MAHSGTAGATAPDWGAVMARLELLEDAADTKVAGKRSRAPAWLGWAAAALGAAYAGYDQTAAAADHETAAAIERLEAKVDRLAEDVLVLRANAR